MTREELYDGLAWGERLGGDRPEGQLAELDIEHKATPERVDAARQLFPEATLSEFEPVGRKWRHRETGVTYTVAADQVLLASDPRRSGIEMFVVAGDRLMFMRPYGFDAAEVGVPGVLVSGQLVREPSGTVRVIDKTAPS